MRKIAALLLIAAICSAPVYAQLGEAPMPQVAPKENTATLEQTQRWLEGKVNILGYHPYGGGSEKIRKEIFFDGCQFTVVDITGEANQPTAYRMTVWFGSLSDLGEPIDDADIAAIGGNKIYLSNPLYVNEMSPSIRDALRDGDRSTIASLIPEVKKTGDPVRSYLYFGTTDEVMGARIGAAFAHAGKLCRAQDKAKRDAELAKSAKRADEPF